MTMSMTAEAKLSREAAIWPGIVAAPHRFDAVEWKLRGKEVGHFHRTGQLDIPFTKALGQQLIAEGLADVHHWVPNSGWVGYRVTNQRETAHALWLLRLSYLYKALTLVGKEGPLTLEEIKTGLAELGVSRAVATLVGPVLARRER